MLIRISTAQFTSDDGAIDCRICKHRTFFPQPVMLLVYNYQHRQAVIAADTGAALHLCGQQFVWECVRCGTSPYFDPKRALTRKQRRGTPLPVCMDCGGWFHQVPPTVPDISTR